MRTFLPLLTCVAFLSLGAIHAVGQDDSATVPEDSLDVKVVGAAEPVEKEQTALTIGSPAPELDVEHWVQDGNGKFPWVTTFEPGKVYVVEFWATWCGPCIAAMPHVAELQTKHSDTVQVVSISREDLETVEKFLEREIRKPRAPAAPQDATDEEEKEEDEPPAMTYRDLTSVYCLTADPDGSSSQDYMTAAGQNGIPCAFLVGKSGLIEWIGHPMVIDEPLDAVLDGSWDREAFRKEFEIEQRADILQTKVIRLMRSGKTDDALEMLEAGLSDEELVGVRANLQRMKLQILVSSDEHEEEAVAYLMERLADPDHDASSANDLAWLVFRLADLGRFEDDAVTAGALELAQLKVDGAGKVKPYIMDTVARLLSLTGQIDEAIATQKQAIELADDRNRPDMQKFLDQLQAGQEKPDAAEDTEAQ